MPAKSAKQYGLMQAAAHGSITGAGANGSSGPTQAVAKEFVAKTPPKKRKTFMKSLMSKQKAQPFQGV